MNHVHRLELTVTDGLNVLDRVLGVCRSRQCTVVSVHFEASDRHRPGTVLLGLRADAPRAQAAIERLASLVDVLSVDGSRPASHESIRVT